VQPLLGQWSAPLSKRVAANIALLESGTVPTDQTALLNVLDLLVAPEMRVIGAEDALTPAACMRAMTLVLNVHGSCPLTPITLTQPPTYYLHSIGLTWHINPRTAAA
jgi:hypothetical protein